MHQRAPLKTLAFVKTSTVKYAELVGSGCYVEPKLPTDAIGALALTLENLVVGSAIRIETAAGDLVAFRVAASSAEAFSVPAYVVGNPRNNLRIKVRKASAAPFYIPFETQATAYVGTASIFVSQIPDE